MPSPIDPQTPAIDPETIETLRMLQEDGGPDLVAELFDLFYTDVPVRFDELAVALDNSDAGALASIAHGLKSASANIGCLGFSEICRQLEALGRSQSCEGARDLVSYLAQEYARIQDSFQNNYAQAA